MPQFLCESQKQIPLLQKTKLKKKKTKKQKQKKRNMAVAIPKGRKSCKFLTPQTSNVSNYPEL